MRVLITRPAEDAAASAAALQARGHAVVIAPLLAVEPEPAPAIKLAGAQGFIVTGPEAVRVLADAIGVRTFPVFADSAGTASALKRLGFGNVYAANGDIAELARLIERTVKPATGALIHACSTTAPVNLSAMLGNMGFAVRAWPLYTLKRADVLPENLRDALKYGALDAAVFFAADEARAFVQLVQKAEMDSAAKKIPVIAATPIVAAPLRALKFASITVPDAADEDSVIAALDKPLVDKVAEEQKDIAREAAARLAAEEAKRAEEERRRAEQERLEQERKETEDAARAKAAAEKAEAERLAREKAEAERLAREQAAKEKAERDEAERQRREAERAEKEKLKREQQERERLEKEQRDAERREQERLEKAKRDQEKAEQEKLRQEQKEKERLEKEKRAAEKAEQDRIEKARRDQDRAEQERIKQEQREKDRLAREKAEAERQEKERLIREQREKERAERERIEREQEERARQEREKYEAEQAARAKAEREALLREREARDRAEAERRAKELADDEKARREAAERERLARAEAERLREEQQRLDKERKEQERIEKERLKREQDERDRIAREKAEAERREREIREHEEKEAADRKRAEEDRIERERRALEKEEQDRLKRERDEKEREEREAAKLRSAEEERLEKERRAAEKEEQDKLKREQAARDRIAKAEHEKQRQEQDAAAKAEREAAKLAEAERKRIAKEDAEKQKAARKQAEKEQAAAARAEKERLKAEAAANVPPRQQLMERFLTWKRAPKTERTQPLEIEPPATADTTNVETSDTLPPVVAAPEPAPVLDIPEPMVTPVAPQLEEKPVQPLPDSETDKTQEEMHTGAPVDAAPRPRKGGRAARLQAEDAADQRRFHADKTETSSAETVTEEPLPPPPERQSGGFGRVVGFVIVLALLVGAVMTTRDWWVPRVMQTVQPASAPVATPPASSPTSSNELTALATRVAALEKRPAPAAGVSTEALAALRQDLEKRIAAMEGRPVAGGDSTEAVTSLGGSIGEQARQLVALTARVATLESAVGNIARLEDMNKRLQTLEGKSADAASVLALGDRVGALETGARRAVSEQTAAVAFAMAVGNLRETVAAGRPFALELETAKAMAAKGGAHAIDDASFAAFAAQGIAPTAELRLQFDTVAAAVMRASVMPDVNASWLRRTFDRLLNVISIRRVDGLPDGNSASAVLARAEAQLRAGNLAGSVDEMSALTGAGAEAAKAWLAEARARVAAEKAIAQSSAEAIAVLAREPAAPAPEGN